MELRSKHTSYCCAFLFLLLATSLFGQEKTCEIMFHPIFGNSNLDNSFKKLNGSDSIQIETLKFYISGIELLNNDEIVWKEESSFHLIDITNDQSLNIHLKKPENVIFNKIKFNLGIDSLTNISGAMGGDLDPTKGMYWTWQSGYINFKLEGRCNLCKTRNNEFQFHLGGYQFPFYNLQTLMLNANDQKIMNINIDLKKGLESIDISKRDHIMSPGPDAQLFSERFSKAFSVQP